jgi:hypothetical protein
MLGLVSLGVLTIIHLSAPFDVAVFVATLGVVLSASCLVAFLGSSA